MDEIIFFASLLEKDAFANERFGPSPANSSKNITPENAKWPSMVADALFDTRETERTAVEYHNFEAIRWSSSTKHLHMNTKRRTIWAFYVTL